MKIGILGYGEIGQAIHKMYSHHSQFQISDYESVIMDKTWARGKWKNIDVLNVCIPYSDDFVNIVIDKIQEGNCELVIIHSTIPVGTTRKIQTKLGELTPVVHSPVRGIHPNLVGGLRTFTKYVGYISKKGRDRALGHMKNIGYGDLAFVEHPETTELGKLVSTSYYGLCIAWHGEVKKMCDQFDVPFEIVMASFNDTYNEGYKKLGKENVVRPTLLAPPPTGIGGHCIVPNAELLDEQVDSPALKLIKDYKKK